MAHSAHAGKRWAAQMRAGQFPWFPEDGPLGRQAQGQGTTQTQPTQESALWQALAQTPEGQD